MTFSFNQPLLLFLLPAAILLIYLTYRKLTRLSKWRRRTILTLRVMVFLLLIACVAGLGIRTVSDHTTNVFVVDGSDSTAKARETAEKFIQEAVKNKKSSDRIGVLQFGADTAVEQVPSEKPGFSSLQTKINSNFTNLEQGLKLAASLIPSGDRKRIVLVTDGKENVGDALKQVRQLRQQDITVDVFPLKSVAGPEVQLKEITVPETLRQNEKFEVVAWIDSTIKTKAVLKLFTDRELIAEKNIELQEGENNFAFYDTAHKGGMITYTAVVEPDNDTTIKNNSLSTFTYIEDVGQVLVIQDEDEGASEIVKMLQNDLKVKVYKPDNAPVALEELQKYDAFIISNVSADRLNDQFLNNLEVCIKHQGKGLLVTGGENSYAPGGYYKTPLEKVLPVNMDIKPKEEAPNLGLVLVIDKSGSMSAGQYGVSKVELAKEAAIRSTEVLRKNDMIGVIGFDTAVQWVVKTQKLDNLKAVQDAIGTIRADGGTSILPSLEEAYKSLKNAKTKLKHIILLTDGQAEKAGYETVIENMDKAGITLSTVAVGREADAELLQALSIGGNGRFYMTDEFTDIPKIFAKETFLAGKTYLNNRTFTPNLISYNEILKDISAVPALDGYVGTTPKSTARVVFTSDRDEPILAVWQYGLGRTAAWTPDVKGMWTSGWLQWEQSPKFWKNLVSWLLQKKVSGDYSIKGSMAGGEGKIELTLPVEEKAQGEKVEAIMIDPKGSEQKIPLEPTAPGVYKGVFQSEETGVYVANISVKNGNETVKNINTGISVPYSPEYDISNQDPMEFLKRLAHEGGGRLLKNSRDVFSGKLEPVVGINDITPLLLSLAILLFLLDIALRRLNIPLTKLEAALQKVKAGGEKFTGTVIRPVAEKAKQRIPFKHRTLSSESRTDLRSEVLPDEEKKLELQNMKKTGSMPATPVGKVDQNSDTISVLLQKKRKRDK